MSVVLIIDDEVSLCRLLERRIEHLGHSTFSAHTIREGLSRAHEVNPDVVFLDVTLPDGNGLDAIQLLKNVVSTPEIIMMTGNAEVESAELATRRGAWSYIMKGDSTAPILNALSSALDYRSEKGEPGLAIVPEEAGIVGTSASLRACIEPATQAAASDSGVLLTGETGTGKELFARAIHNHSARRNANFVVVDCTALPASLVESILFGHTKGAFTGADKGRNGLVKQADGGTLFLDEVGELPLSLQKPFLRVLQEHRFRPIGSDEEIQSDFRLIAATRRDLAAMGSEGLFREDLYYRLRTFEIHLPPLRERDDDAIAIVHHHVKAICERLGVLPKRLSPDFLEVLSRYDWPGNVRELVQAVERAVVSAQFQETVFAKHLPETVRIAVARQVTAASLSRVEAPASKPLTAPTLKEVRESAADAAEREYLVRLMADSGGIQEACSAAGLSRSRLYSLLKKHAITPHT